MMALEFPNKPEIRLRKSPLDEVICQVKFPPILKITKETPVELQEAIRDRFPDLQVEQGFLIQFPKVGSSEKPLVETPPRVHRFIRPDNQSHATLGHDFFSLSTKAYQHWDEFTADFQLLETAVRNIYHLPYATRIGLRFINRFSLNNTGSNSIKEVLDLFRSEFTCLFQTKCWQQPEEMISQIIIADGQAKLAIRSKYGSENQIPFFIMDFDYFQEGRLALENLIETLTHFHDRIYQAFRWSIFDESLERFDPEPKQDIQK
jgi:uncharacterized protein (TIGR04255 family)